ncbi:MAG TPA: OmpA family protein [Steroidobacteraceae bacterium]|nr:OmpA family protein [Steroidobacteraceae bacterium]
MSRILPLAAIVLACCTRVSLAASALPPDQSGCKDVFVSRMTGYYLFYCEMNDFSQYKFLVGGDQETAVEGLYVENHYFQPDDATPNSPIKVERNYENALTASGWTILDKGDDHLTAKQVKNGTERWVELSHDGGSGYYLVLMQKAGMAQSVITATDMTATLNRDGRISLHLNFDTGKSTIKPDSLPVVDQIVTMMKSNPGLQLSVEGNTDNEGSPQANQTLSQARAQAVVTSVSGAGIAASRMTAIGYGQDKPVADNGTDEGRAQNRRVDLVKK